MRARLKSLRSDGVVVTPRWLLGRHGDAENVVGLR